ncbi:MAG: hypothetical protein HC883_05460, partial [Bdellovibrionaceae bacterium]|nr:hypothetical protein [Pseudobdellovibrionaceae bacterium]
MLLQLVLLSSAASAQFEQLRDYTTPLKKLTPAEYPSFADDYDLQGMEAVIQKQLQRFQNKNLSGKITMGGHQYPLRLAKNSLTVFLQLTRDFQACIESTPKPACYATLNREVQTRF